MADDALFMCDVPVQCYNNLFMRLLTRLIKMLNFVSFHVTAVQGYVSQTAFTNLFRYSLFFLFSFFCGMEASGFLLLTM